MRSIRLSHVLRPTHIPSGAMQLFVSRGTVTKVVGVEYAYLEDESILSRMKAATLGEIKGGKSYTPMCWLGA